MKPYGDLNCKKTYTCKHCNAAKGARPPTEVRRYAKKSARAKVKKELKDGQF